jgi:folate-binding protein YgfZ
VSIQLARAELVELSGLDAIAFAHNQFTSDVASLAERNWQWSAWLDAQGRARQVFALLRPEPQRLLAWLPRGNATDMAAQLTRYVMRSKLRVSALPDWSLFDAESIDIQGSPLTEASGGWAFDMPGSQARHALIAPSHREDPEAGPKLLARWLIADIAAGLPWIATEVAGEFVAQALGLDRIGAISMSKGCYPGQEIVARLHYRGGNKRHCHRLHIVGDTPVPGHGVVSDALPGQRGTILYAAPSGHDHCEALAVLPEALAQADALRLESGATVQSVSRDFPPARPA